MLMSDPVTLEMIYEVCLKNSADIQQNSADIRNLYAICQQNSVDIQKNGTAIQELKEELRDFKSETSRRFSYLENRLDRLDSKVEEIWHSRDKVRVDFSRGFAFVNALISAIVSGSISYTASR